MPGLILAAPSSNSGKTVLTLALLRALNDRGVRVAAAKIGPDYIDPAFQRAAARRETCLNLDPWAMDAAQVLGEAARLESGSDLVLCEGVMGLFDGAADGTGSSADLAALTGWPVILVMDVTGQAATAAAVIQGLTAYRDDIEIAGILLNRVGGPRHRRMIEAALDDAVPVLGSVGNDPVFKLPKRHLGLVQAREHAQLDRFLAEAGAKISTGVDLERLQACAKPAKRAEAGPETLLLPPLGQRIALASDRAFSFCYDGLLDHWRAAGAECVPFSPLANDAPAPDCDAIYLPGGYPELHAGVLSTRQTFFAGLRRAADNGTLIYGECGGYMVLGDTLVDAAGHGHPMAGLLPLSSDFHHRKRHLGYRRARLLAPLFSRPAGTWLKGHEFHYASWSQAPGAPALLQAEDATGAALAPMGLRNGRVMGSFFHVIAEETSWPKSA